ncbi:hypothetical protein H104_04797 [Trichophyton rubrum CBS 289.86]|nr:hypothetical protein H104_04797 [Trichophyton rubrum CBS 289.86]EZF83986.1 hypothetical protein H110_04806 [Trichophyton rubrum MR1448]
MVYYELRGPSRRSTRDCSVLFSKYTDTDIDLPHPTVLGTNSIQERGIYTRNLRLARGQQSVESNGVTIESCTATPRFRVLKDLGTMKVRPIKVLSALHNT